LLTLQHHIKSLNIGDTVSLIPKCDGEKCSNNSENYQGNIYELNTAAASTLGFNIAHLCEDCIEKYFKRGDVEVDTVFMEISLKEDR
jgi:hypothetical protein